MESNDEYESVADRQKAAQARVHSDLTKTCRERVAQITANPLRFRVSDINGIGTLPGHLIEQAVAITYEDVGYGIREYFKPETEKPILSHRKIIENSDTLDTLAYLENLLEFCHSTGTKDWQEYRISGDGIKERMENVRSRIEQTADKVNTALETEGVLWELKYDEGRFDFKPIGSEMMVEADKEFSVIASGKRWTSVISPYRDAYRLYRNRTYGREIPEKLYNSIEELAKIICVDLEGWEENRERSLSRYLDLMRDNELFEPNNIMRAELSDLTDSMEKAFQKSGAERKNRHSEIDREYATLLLHQVSAYLTYIIRQYEEKYGEGTD